MTGLPWTGRARLRTPAGAGTRLRIEFRYWTRPQRGIYFVRPDKAYPGVAPEIWSQGEPTDNRRWFPTWDEPNQKTPSELILTVPHGWAAIANGYLKAHTYTAATDIWDWNAPAPKPTYLIAFAAGPLVRNHTTLGDMNVDSFVQPQFANLNALCFGRTKDMIAYFQRIIGVPFPFVKYDRAVLALAQYSLRVRHPQLAFPVLVDLVTRDPLISTRIAAARALGVLHDKAGIPVLQRVERTESQEIVRETVEKRLIVDRKD
ncbi:MAG: hypothetical protein ACXVAM_19135 [Vulcanimicrobiaceae bacterium]